MIDSLKIFKIFDKLMNFIEETMKTRERNWQVGEDILQKWKYIEIYSSEVRYHHYHLQQGWFYPTIYLGIARQTSNILNHKKNSTT